MVNLCNPLNNRLVLQIIITLNRAETLGASCIIFSEVNKQMFEVCLIKNKIFNVRLVNMAIALSLA